MNTRLQVEHPVTEAITGIDLVEQMIRVAAGEKLEMTQDDIKIDGWAIENRVYAEDPYRGFLPSTGRLVRYRTPVPAWAGNARGEDGVRVDAGVEEGGEVSIFYDPMIAKLVTWGETRDEAADKQIAALDRFEIEGLGHNIDFVSAIMQHPRFRSGELTTGFIAEEYPDGFHGAATEEHIVRALAAIAGFMASAEADRARRTDGQLGDRLDPPAKWQVTVGGTEHKVKLGQKHIKVDDEKIDIALEYTPGDRLVIAEIDDAELAVKVAKTRAGWRMTTRGRIHDVRVLPWHVAPLTRHMIEKIPPDLSRFLICPMPGLLVALHVGEVLYGQRCADGGRGDEDGEYPARRKDRHGEERQCGAGRQPGGRSGDFGDGIIRTPIRAELVEAPLFLLRRAKRRTALRQAQGERSFLDAP